MIHSVKLPLTLLFASLLLSTNAAEGGGDTTTQDKISAIQAKQAWKTYLEQERPDAKVLLPTIRSWRAIIRSGDLSAVSVLVLTADTLQAPMSSLAMIRGADALLKLKALDSNDDVVQRAVLALNKYHYLETPQATLLEGAVKQMAELAAEKMRLARAGNDLGDAASRVKYADRDLAEIFAALIAAQKLPDADYLTEVEKAFKSDTVVQKIAMRAEQAEKDRDYSGRAPNQREAQAARTAASEAQAAADFLKKSQDDWLYRIANARYFAFVVSEYTKELELARLHQAAATGK